MTSVCTQKYSNLFETVLELMELLTQKTHSVVSTSIRCHQHYIDVFWALKRRTVSTGSRRACIQNDLKVMASTLH